MKMKILAPVISVAMLVACQQSSQPAQSPQSPIRKGMVKVSILYPNGEGKHFDMDYYVKTHMPLVATLFGDSLKALSIDKGIGSGRPGPMPYLAIGHLYFERLSAYEGALAPYTDTIRKDILKYTNIAPVIQISEVLE